MDTLVALGPFLAPKWMAYAMLVAAFPSWLGLVATLEKAARAQRPQPVRVRAS